MADAESTYGVPSLLHILGTLDHFLENLTLHENNSSACSLGGLEEKNKALKKKKKNTAMQEHIWWDFASFRSWRTTITEINQNTYEEEKEEKKKKRKEKRGCECLAESPIHMSMLNSPSVLFQSYGVHKHMKDDRTRLVHWDTKHFMFNSEERQGCRRWTPPPPHPPPFSLLSLSLVYATRDCVCVGGGMDRIHKRPCISVPCLSQWGTCLILAIIAHFWSMLEAERSENLSPRVKTKRSEDEDGHVLFYLPSWHAAK